MRNLTLPYKVRLSNQLTNKLMVTAFGFCLHLHLNDHHNNGRHHYLRDKARGKSSISTLSNREPCPLSNTVIETPTAPHPR